MDDSYPSDNYGLTEWLDGYPVSSPDGVRTAVMQNNKNLTAVFQVVQ